MARTRYSSSQGKRPPADLTQIGSVAVTDLISPAPIVIDRYRAFVFPNRVREQRQHLGCSKLMQLSNALPSIPYIRLSKIERGEVVARADELRQIARTLAIAPVDLLSDLSEPGFDIAAWAEPFQDKRPVPIDEERMAVLLAASLRVMRYADARLTIAALDRDYDLPPVILSRLENAYKTLDRWNGGTLDSLCRLFGVVDAAALRDEVEQRYRRGELDAFVNKIADPNMRMARSRDVTTSLRHELSRGTDRQTEADPARPAAARSEPHQSQSAATAAAVSSPQAAESAPAALPVFGVPIAGGLIGFERTSAMIDAPAQAGPRAFALRVCRATLGPGLPASAVVVADPDRPTAPGGLVAIRTAQGFRLATITFDRMGATKGYTTQPAMEIDIDDIDPVDVIAITAAVYP
ncbi:helix-turn-helix domain-containing protein [Sphingomonas sp. 37zxx]|uniref:helix-turn-helix domain-containing protein n=1 Tax=Sphingomonas sp. 37zxx TaxID=1550073 RepID=UPI001E5BF6AC|nr:helix-turn-helix transcriptional regulator [Sphingomonas sp. 37zxx]